MTAHQSIRKLFRIVRNNDAMPTPLREGPLAEIRRRLGLAGLRDIYLGFTAICILGFLRGGTEAVGDFVGLGSRSLQEITRNFGSCLFVIRYLVRRGFVSLEAFGEYSLTARGARYLRWVGASRYQEALKMNAAKMKSMIEE
jgi:hypothetical protein